MILDKSLEGGSGLNYDADSAVIDLGAAGVGQGEPIDLMVQGSADLAGATGIVIVDGATEVPADALLTLIRPMTGETFKVTLPSSTNRYIMVSLAGAPSAGTWSCGIMAPGIQNNR